MSKKLSTEDFIERSRLKHSVKYNYNVTTYLNVRTKVKITCPVHGVFLIYPSDHMRGVGCAACYHDSQKLSTTSFIDKALKVHGSCYQYNLVEYIRHDLEVMIICPIHGSFKQKPYHHLTGRGCRQCFVDDMIVNASEFLHQSSIVHGNKYSYDMSNYDSLHSVIRITCPIHGAFIQKANNHFNGSGCWACSLGNTSKMEELWLDSLNIPLELRNKVIFFDGKRYNVDAFDITTNTIYEFYGDYWHGNPNAKPKRFSLLDIHPIRKISFGQLYEDTMKREKKLMSHGNSIVSIWETDFRNRL